MIQFGLPIVDTPFDDEAINGTSKGMFFNSNNNKYFILIYVTETILKFSDRKIEPIPSLFQEFIERLMTMEVLKVKPDSCVIDIYNEVSSDS